MARRYFKPQFRTHPEGPWHDYGQAQWSSDYDTVEAYAKANMRFAGPFKIKDCFEVRVVSVVEEIEELLCFTLEHRPTLINDFEAECVRRGAEADAAQTLP